ncbi:MAG: hypothetical protein O2905_02370 [Proteobacteria bacterium]|nr:hypothetical protein [Pseudomonadota bacterium]
MTGSDATHGGGHESGDGKPPFWVTRAGARIALVALHLVALGTVVTELVRPFIGDGHGAERIHELEFLASYAVYGFVACVVLVLLGRELRRLVMRGEDYYGDRD